MAMRHGLCTRGGRGSSGFGPLLLSGAILIGGVLAAPSSRAEEPVGPGSRTEAERRAVCEGSQGTWIPVASEPWHAWLVGGAGDAPGEPRTTPPVDVTARPSQVPLALAAPEYPYGGGWSPDGSAERTRLGPWHQPEWTTERRFTRVRTYVIAPWQVEVETWYRLVDKKDAPNGHLLQQEVALGLPSGWQVDVYGNFAAEGDESLEYAQTQLEVRKALAPWGCLPLNPTLYGEYKIAAHKDDPDVAEAKLLLCEELGCHWVAGANLVYERELSGAEEEVFGFSAAASYTLIDQRLSIGAEMQYEHVTEAGARDDPAHEIIVGPSVQIRFGRSTHLDIAPLFGVTDDAPSMKLYVVFGIDIGPRGPDGGWLNPISAAGR